jgi:hypothetical protein
MNFLPPGAIAGIVLCAKPKRAFLKDYRNELVITILVDWIYDTRE